MRAEAQFGDTDDTWVIRVQSPKHLRDIDAYTVKKGAEHLAPLMEQYEVVSVDKAQRTIDMKEIPDGEKKTTSSQFAAGRSDFKEFSKMMGDYRRGIQNGTIPRPVLTEDEQLLADHMQYG